jgi:hypothetical protein
MIKQKKLKLKMRPKKSQLQMLKLLIIRTKVKVVEAKEASLRKHKSNQLKKHRRCGI